LDRPQIHQRGRIYQLHPSTELPCFPFGILGEAGQSDEKTDIVIAEYRHEAAQPRYVDLCRLEVAFDLDLDAWATGAERVGKGHQVHATVLPRWRNPSNVVPHGGEQASDKLLEVVLIHHRQVGLDLAPGGFFRLLQRDACRLLGALIDAIASAEVFRTG